MLTTEDGTYIEFSSVFAVRALEVETNDLSIDTHEYQMALKDVRKALGEDGVYPENYSDEWFEEDFYSELNSEDWVWELPDLNGAR